MGNSIEPHRLVRIDIPLPHRSFIAVGALVRYCNENRCGFEFVDVEDQQRRAIRGACEILQRDYD